MAMMNYSSRASVCVHPRYPFAVPNKIKPKLNHLISVPPMAALSEKGSDGSVTDNDPLKNSASSSTRTQLDLLEQLTTNTSSGGYESDAGNSGEITIREQLAQLVGDRDDDFSIPLGKNIKKVTAKFLTLSQKRNIKRQEYLNEVSKRNDTNFFATIGAFVLLPPLIILAVAIATGYVQLFP